MRALRRSVNYITISVSHNINLKNPIACVMSYVFSSLCRQRECESRTRLLLDFGFRSAMEPLLAESIQIQEGVVKSVDSGLYLIDRQLCHCICLKRKKT